MNKLNNICATIFENFKRGNTIAPLYDYDIPAVEYISWNKCFKNKASDEWVNMWIEADKIRIAEEYQTQEANKLNRKRLLNKYKTKVIETMIKPKKQ
tara:strand:+ start:740 stop:1030 length:291 start_codon:yes stop_codon:yes gene_type:complete